MNPNRTVATTLRWLARALSGLILLFWGWLILAHVFGTAAPPSRPLTASDIVLVVFMLAVLAGLIIAWWREPVGAAVTLAAVLMTAFLNSRAVTGLGLLPPTCALLFLLAWRIGRIPLQRPAA